MSSSDYTNRLKYCNPQPPCCVNVFPTVNVDICGTQFDISHADVYADSALVDICSAIINAESVNLDISSATIDVFNATMNTATLNLDISGVIIDVSSATINSSVTNLDISNATIDVFNANMNTATLNLDISSVAIDVSNATINSAVTNLDVSSLTVDVSNATLQVDTVILDVSSVSVTADTAVIDISNATITPLNATVDICNSAVAISNVTLSGDLGVLSNADAFDRLRVSNPFTLFEFTSILGKQTDIIDEQVIGAPNASSTAVLGESYISMQVSGPGSVVRQTHEYIPYQSGKSKLIYMTGVLQDPSGRDMSGNTTRIGSFDASMGFYIESSGGIVSVVQHNSVYERAYRVGPPIYDPSASVWSDPLDGTGPSGINVDFRKAQILMFDFAWLGVGQVRCGVMIGGKPIFYYTFTHTNQLTMPYIPMAKLPLRYEITGSLGAAPNELRMMCGTVLSEGGYTPITRTLTYGRYQTATALTNGSALRGLFAIRIRPTFPYNRVSIKLKNIDLFNITGGTSSGAWVALLNPDISGISPVFTDYDTNISAAEICDLSGIGIVTGGSIIYSGFYATRDYNQLNASIDELNASRAITMGLSGTQDTVVIAANSLGSGNPVSLFYFVNWVEYI